MRVSIVHGANRQRTSKHPVTRRLDDMQAANTQRQSPALDAAAAPSRREPYEAPKLERLGDVRELTLGGSIGNGDSGAPQRQARIGGV